MPSMGYHIIPKRKKKVLRTITGRTQNKLLKEFTPPPKEHDL